MNYIKHLNQWMELVSVDDRITPHHISIYLALFQFWNKYRFPRKITIFRHEVLQLSKVGSTKTYYKCLHQLHEYGYIQYLPSHNPLKGSAIIMNDLCDFDQYTIAELEESPDKSSTEPEEKSVKNNDNSSTSTQVTHEQNRHISCGKNATSGNLKVTPLLINNINLINYKQRERRAHVRNKWKHDFKKGRGKDVGKNSRSAASGSPTEDSQKSRSVSDSPSGARLESKKYVPRDFLIPTLDQVKDFFSHQLSGNYLNGILDTKSRMFEAEKFFNHYESNGWLLGGKVPMRNWKASCRSWAAKIPYFNREQFKSRANERKNLHVERFDNYDEPL